MKFKNSPYYNQEFLGKRLYNNINEYHEIFTVQEYFEINDEEKSYQKIVSSSLGRKDKYYKLRIFKNYYQLNCEDYVNSAYIVFDKPVRVTGEYCEKIIAPEIYIKGKKIEEIENCFSTSIFVDNNYKYGFTIGYSKINNIHFYNNEVCFKQSEIDNFYIKNRNISFLDYSSFLNYCKIKIFGKSNDLKYKMSKYENFKEGIIHIE